MNLSKYFSNEQLTQGQQELLIKLQSFLQKSSDSTFLLKGYAGTGKTHITAGITRYLMARKREFVILAPTGKAASVISRKTRCPAYTIHRAIYNFCESTHEEQLVEDETHQEPPHALSEVSFNDDNFDTVYIVDEASMVSDVYNDSDCCEFGSGYLLNDLIQHINPNGTNRKIIMIGDVAQLPPVGSSYSPALDEWVLNSIYNLKCQSYELTEVVRQKDKSGVMDNAKKLREELSRWCNHRFEFNTASADVSRLSTYDFLKKYVEALTEKGAGTEDAIIIAFTNKQIRKYNNYVRGLLFLPKTGIQVGEAVVCTCNHKVDKYKIISNGEFGKIKRVLPGVECRSIKVMDKVDGCFKPVVVDLNFVVLQVEFINSFGEPYLVTEKVLLNLLERSSPRPSSLENKALYVDFKKRNFINNKASHSDYIEAKLSDPYLNFLHLNFGYAITCHRAQGSEFKNVFVDTYQGRQESEQYIRWLYTAITRTSDKLYIK
ncbi:MAG: AAA family ATPase [Colwellia polaris]|jgi:ATP-dependent exoDNAse (exonuclease V) alpha subunit